MRVAHALVVALNGQIVVNGPGGRPHQRWKPDGGWWPVWGGVSEWGGVSDLVYYYKGAHLTDNMLVLTGVERDIWVEWDAPYIHP